MNYLYNVKNIDHQKHRILVVAPTTLLTTWANEIEKFLIDTKNFNWKIIQGQNNALKILTEKIKEGISKNNNEDLTELANNNVDVINLLRKNIYITTYETLSTYQLVFGRQDLFNFVMVVYDEAQKIKNPNARVSVAAKAISSNIPFSLIATGTPIENELRDLWSLFDTFDPSFIGSWKNFRNTYVTPYRENNALEIDTRLRDKISNYMLRRLKKDHLIGLPDKITYDGIQNEPIVCVMNNEEKSLQHEILSSGKHHMEKLQELRLLSLHPSLLSIEQSISYDRMVEITKPDNFFKTSKMSELKKLLDEIQEKKEKVLVFVIRYAMQTLLKSALDSHYGINTTIINGKNNKQDYVDSKLAEFKEKKGFDIMILSPLAAGMGLTITAANHVVHLERHWNPAKEDQASDRVYRIGQEKPVFIYHLIHQNKSKTDSYLTFDEGLNKLITQKRALSDGTLIPTPTVRDSEIIGTFFNINDGERIDLMSGLEFEHEVKMIFERHGFKCSLTDTYPTENGADIIGQKGNIKIIVQCKHTSRNERQGRDAMRQLIAESMPTYGDAIYIAATNYYFNDNARNLASSNQIKLLEREAIINCNLSDIL
jgi:SNF2 family DNA or RNA helicase